MAINLEKFVKKQSKLVEKKSTTRVSKIDLTNKKIRGEAKLHIIPDVTGLPMLTTKGVFEVHQTETYEYQDETRTRYPTYIIPSPSNYNNVEGAVMPTDMQMKKLDKLYNLLTKYQGLTNLYQEGGAKLKTSDTETQLWCKYITAYTKFWAKVSDITPTTPDPKAKAIDTSKLLMITHGSANFVKAFNKWATPDTDSEVSVEDQLKKITGAISDEVENNARCVKISTIKAQVGYDVEFKNIKPENASVDITEEDIKGATPLIQEDWDYTNFDDEKVDTLISRLTEYLKDYDDSDENDDDETDDEDSSDESDDDEGNPFADDDDE